ncbi:MAG: helix-turn-helix domain-containing protein [Methanomassiliicoccus sp.]|nr:helix-turn-helix domain-containing protein [Methanomassiliicoccus sp.]
MLRNLEYRLYPTNKQEARLYSTFRLCSEMYNLLLTEHEQPTNTQAYCYPGSI